MWNVLYIPRGEASESSFPWRFPFVFQMLPALLTLAGSPRRPYSPCWLMLQDRFDEAHEVTKRDSTGLRKTLTTEWLAPSITRREQVALDRQTVTRSPLELFKTQSGRKRAIIAFLMMFNNQFTGILVLNNCLVPLFTSLGLTGYLPLLLSAIYVLSNFPGNIFCGLYVERFGRRRFTLIGLTGIVVILSIEAAL